jgi:hypothetical protein
VNGANNDGGTTLKFNIVSNININMLEYVYRLNLPSLQQVLKDNVIDSIYVQKEPLISINPIDLFKTDIQQLKGLDWDSGIIFKKSPRYQGPIHLDGSERSFVWGINWIVGAPGGMRYWPADSDKQFVIDPIGNPRIDFKPSRPADKNYVTGPEQVYLVNASVPHSAYNLSFAEYRYAVTIRASQHGFTTWQQVVDLFSDLII